MEVACNQKIIIVDRTLIKNKIPKELLFSAINKLDNIAFKLWIYIIVQEQDEFALSAADFCKISGKCRSTYKRAVVELIDKGYLNLVDKEKNTYIFNPYPYI